MENKTYLYTTKVIINVLSIMDKNKYNIYGVDEEMKVMDVI